MSLTNERILYLHKVVFMSPQKEKLIKYCYVETLFKNCCHYFWEKFHFI